MKPIHVPIKWANKSFKFSLLSGCLQNEARKSDEHTHNEEFDDFFDELKCYEIFAQIDGIVKIRTSTAVAIFFGQMLQVDAFFCEELNVFHERVKHGRDFVERIVTSVRVTWNLFNYLN